MINKLFGGKKQKFYAELDESQLETPATPEVVKAEPAPKPAVEVAPAAKTDAPSQPASVTAKKSKKTSVKAKKEEAAPAPVAKVAPPAPKPEPTEVKFAAQNLMVPSLVRRRPGPSLSGFKAMVRDVKFPNPR